MNGNDHELFEAIVENSPNLICRFDHDGRLTYVNRAYCRFFQEERETLVGRSFREFVPPEDQAVVARLLEGLSPEMAPIEHRHKVIAPDGTQRLQQWTNLPVKDKDERFLGFIAIGTDVTDNDAALKALEESGRRYRAVVEDQTEFIVRWKPDGTRLFVNEAYLRYFNVSREETIGSSFYSLISDYDREMVRERIAHLTPDRPINSDRHRFLRGDGAWRWQLWLDRGFFDESGNIVELQSVGRDIHDQVVSEGQLMASERLLHNLFEYAGDSIFLLRVDGSFLRVNQVASKTLGYSRQELLKLRIWDVEENVADAEHLTSIISDLKDRESLLFQGEHVRKDGSRFPVEVHITRLQQQGDSLILAFARDVSERKEASQALRESESILARAQEVGRVGSWTSDPTRNKPLSWSRECCRIFGVSSEEFDNRVETFYSLVHPEDRKSVQRAATRSIERNEPYSIEHRIIRPDGTIRWVHEQGDVECDEEGNPVRMLGVVRDITDQKNLEDQLRQSQKLESIGQLAAGIAHDFNNLLTIISGNIDLAKEDGMDQAEQTLVLNDAGEACSRAASLVRQLLLFSRQEKMMPKTIDLSEQCSHLSRMLQRLLGEEILVEFVTEPGLPQIQGDPVMIDQVITNLALNARDAMPRGGHLKLMLTTETMSEDSSKRESSARSGSFVCLAVSDTGEGIPESIRGRIFDPFFTTKEAGKGTGLGLATVYGIVQEHQGWIQLDEANGQGSTFRVFLPAIAPEETLTEELKPSSKPRGREGILLVEDEQHILRFVSKLLGRQGYRVHTAVDGPHSLKIWKEEKGGFDLLLTDLVLPSGMRGHAIAEEFRKTAPELKVLYMSGYSPEKAAGDLELDESTQFIQKPFRNNDLLLKVRDLLDRPS